LKENLRRKDVRLTLKFILQIKIEGLLAVFQKGVCIALPRKRMMTGLMQGYEGLSLLVDGLIEVNSPSLNVKEPKNLGDGSAYRGSRSFIQFREKTFI
jgi:hypothetical protein